MAVIHINARMEAYSRAYVHAVAASAGVAIGSIAPDINGLDVQFMSPDDGDDAGRCAHVQLKSTADELQATGAGDKRYLLRHADYDRLTKLVSIPRFLVVLEVPKDADDWIECGADSLILNASARWLSLRGAPATGYAATSKIPVDLPAQNVFTPEALWDNMGSLNDK
jgi:hypothetical protein